MRAKPGGALVYDPVTLKLIVLNCFLIVLTVRTIKNKISKTCLRNVILIVLAVRTINCNYSNC